MSKLNTRPCMYKGREFIIEYDNNMMDGMATIIESNTQFKDSNRCGWSCVDRAMRHLKAWHLYHADWALDVVCNEDTANELIDLLSMP